MAKHFNRREFRRVPVRGHRQRHLPGARAGGVRAGPALDARRRGDPRAQLPDRRRLRVLGVAPSSSRSCSGRSGSRRSPRTGSRPSRPPPRRRCGSRSARRSGSSRAIGADLGAVFDRAGERLFLVDEQGRELPAEQTLLLFLRLIGEAGWTGQGRRAGHGHEPRRGDRRAGGPRGRAHARGPGGADARPRSPRTASSSRAQSGASTSSRSSCPPTTRSRASASCSSCSRGSSGRSPSSSPSCRAPRVVHRQLACPWAMKGLVMRVLDRAAERPRARPDRRDQGARRRAAGRRCSPTRTSRSSTSTPRAATAELSARARGRAARTRRRGDAGAGIRRRGANLKLRLNLCDGACFNACRLLEQKGFDGSASGPRGLSDSALKRPDPRSSRPRRTRSPTSAGCCTASSTSCAQSSSRGSRRRGRASSARSTSTA